MGFGFLFLGYFFLLNLPIGQVDILPDVLGWLLMFGGLRRLCYFCPQDKNFPRAKLVLIPAAAVSVIVFVLNIVMAGGNSPVLLGARLLYSLLQGAYEVFLLLGIYRLAGSVELPKLAARAGRMLTFTAAYYLLQLVYYSSILNAVLPSYSAAYVQNYLAFAIYILGYLWLILTLALLFTCYARICLEGDEEMPYSEDLFDKLLRRFRGGK